MIMGPDVPELGRVSASAAPASETFSYTLNLSDEANAEVKRVMTKRQLAPVVKSGARTPRQDCPVASVVRRQSSRLQPGVVAVHVLRLSNRRGELIHAEPIVWQVRCSLGRWKRAAREVRAAVEEFRTRASASGEELLAFRIDKALDAAAHAHRAVETAWAQRTRLVLGSLRSQATQLVQQGLFDRQSKVRPIGAQIETLLEEPEQQSNGGMMSVDVRLRAILLVLER
jgi:hypothetical protein